MKKPNFVKVNDFRNLTKIQKISLSVIFTVVITCVICLLISGCSKETSETEDYSYDTNNSLDIKTTTKVKELTKSDIMLMKIVGLIDEKLAFDTGDYIKGDIPVGEYAFVKFSGSGSYYEEEDAAGNIIDNENFDSFGYVKVYGFGNITTSGVLININAFEQLGVSSAKEIYEILNNQENYNQSGYYKVGVDIQPGSYTIESIGSGYYAIMAGPVGNSDIIDNDNFSGRTEVYVREGQYLDVSRAQILQ